MSGTMRMFSDRQSDRLLGQSPMAPSSASLQEGSRIPTQEDVSLAGGIWNPTSAKRDKIAELRTELLEHQYSLDDAATPEQKLDLYLADGLQWIVHTVDQIRLKSPLPDTTTTTAAASVTTNSELETEHPLPRELDPHKWGMDESLINIEKWIEEQQTAIQSTVPDGQLNEQQWKTYLEELSQKIDEVLATLPYSRYLRNIRDFYVVPPDSTDNIGEIQQELLATEDQERIESSGNKALARYRLLLTRAAGEHLANSWETLTTRSDEALDRLAVETDGEEVEGALQTLPLAKLNTVVRSHLYGNAIDRVDAMWNLMDQDDDALLEKTEMETASFLALSPVQTALLALFEEALEAQPVRELPGDNDENNKSGTLVKRGWRQRRREKKEKKRLTKWFQFAVKNHFEDEVEMPHRLRCIYAWAEKAHQNNKLDSVLIEASGWSGRKRYVELQPKISLPEFREVQSIHFTHLDRIGWEIVKSFREDLWVQQGKGRQNAELKRDCALFLAVVSLIDYAIVVF